MKDKLVDLYLRRCQVRRSNSIERFRTVAYKPGKSDDASKRDTKSDFNKVLNGNPKVSLLGSLQDGNAFSYDIQVTHDHTVKAPRFFIDLLEKFVLSEYFEGDERTFDTKNEFIVCYEETTKKYEELNKVLKNKENTISQLNTAYNELDDKQQVNIAYMAGQYNSVLNEIKKELKAFCNPLGTSLDKIAAQKPAPIIPQPGVSNVSQSSKTDLEANLTKDFVLYLDKDKAYLQHRLYHTDLKTKSLKDPKENKGAFTADIVNNKRPKFQFHNNPELAHYTAQCIGVNKAIKIFKKYSASIIDLTNASANQKPVTNGVTNHSSAAN
jgi:hypothetical protein